jgi:two-component system nitrogen regulation sensor histidine kinase NtrY
MAETDKHSYTRNNEFHCPNYLVDYQTHKIFRQDGKPIDVLEVNSKVIENTIQGLEIIGDRGSGLLNFVTNYRCLTKIPTPVFNPFSAADWLNIIKILLFERLQENLVTLEINISKFITTINGYEKLLTQVLINLIYNAIDTLKEKDENRVIKLLIDQNPQKQIQITVANNGAMVPSDIQDKIFIPFFTTRNNSSGIGLSLSRQIIQLNNGYIYLESDEKLTKFLIVI